MKAHSLFCAVVVGFALPSCSLVKPLGTVTKPEAKKEITMFEWHGEDVPGSARVTIDLGEQKAHIFKGGKEVGWTYVATGVEEHRTPTGTFNIMEKVEDKHSNLWGIIVNKDGETVEKNAHNGVTDEPPGGHFVGAPMPHWMRLTDGGVGMHGGYIPHPGSPASHGCIRLPYDMATYLYKALPEGTPVTIIN